MQDLYDSGARSFLFLTIPPAYRAPQFVSEGQAVASQFREAMEDYNAQLISHVQAFESTYPGLDFVKVVYSSPIFNSLLDDAQTLGYVNTTGYCEAYVNGTGHVNVRVAPCAPAFSYLWVVVSFP